MYSTRWKKRAKNVIESLQELNNNNLMNKMGPTIDMLETSDDLLSKKSPNKLKCCDNDSQSVQILA